MKNGDILGFAETRALLARHCATLLIDGAVDADNSTDIAEQVEPGDFFRVEVDMCGVRLHLQGESRATILLDMPRHVVGFEWVAGPGPEMPSDEL
ncbi:hypothetical protein [Geopseudomonas aromaticivorans]